MIPVRIPRYALVLSAAAALSLLASCAGRPAPAGLACSALPGALAALPGLQISQASNQQIGRASCRERV